MHQPITIHKPVVTLIHRTVVQPNLVDQISSPKEYYSSRVVDEKRESYKYTKRSRRKRRNKRRQTRRRRRKEVKEEGENGAGTG